jgi:hypothetical protein
MRAREETMDGISKAGGGLAEMMVRLESRYRGQADTDELDSGLAQALKAYHALVKAYGVGRYARELELVMSGELPDADLFRIVRQAWRDVRQEGDSLLLSGEPGTGKSVCALWCCLQQSMEGMPWAYHDAAELWTMVRLRRWDELQGMRHTGLLVLDEINSATLGTSSVSELRLLIDLRYRAGKGTILVTNHSPKVLVDHLGANTIDRIPPKLRIIAQDADSLRPISQKR